MNRTLIRGVLAVAVWIGLWKGGGGYVFNNVHNIQAGVPAENIVALFEAAYQHGCLQEK